MRCGSAEVPLREVEKKVEKVEEEVEEVQRRLREEGGVEVERAKQ